LRNSFQVSLDFSFEAIFYILPITLKK